MSKAKLRVVSVYRDYFQVYYANGIPKDHPLSLKLARLFDKLRKTSNDNIEFTAYEGGGAHPQVTVEKDKRDFLDVYRKLRKEAPWLPIRPLWRGANGFLLEPSHIDDLEFVLTEFAKAVAQSSLSDAEKKELLRIKIFDSQGIIRETESSLEIVRRLRAKGYAVTAEMAIPYSSGPAYPDILYVEKVLDAARALKKFGIPPHESHISLKDMVGDLSKDAIKKLLPQILKALKREGLPVPFGLHAHDTGLAEDCYIAAREVCLDPEFDYPLTIDTVECAPVDKSFTGDKAWKNTGFASTLSMHKKLIAQGKPEGLGLNVEQISIMEEMAETARDLSLLYKAKRADLSLTGEDCRDFRIAGGGFSSYSNAVGAMDLGKGLAKQLGISEKNALKIAGYALMAVGVLMGQPHPVTPGFQNKQHAALNYLKNLIDAKEIKRGMSIKNMRECILRQGDNYPPLTNKQVEDYFLKDLNPIVERFLTGEMPVETVNDLRQKYEKMGISADKILQLFGPPQPGVHPAIRAKFPRRTTLLTDGKESRLKDANIVAKELLTKGIIKATPTQVYFILQALQIEEKTIDSILAAFAKPRADLDNHSVTYDRPDGSEKPWQKTAYNVLKEFVPEAQASRITRDMEQAVLDTHTAWALMLRNTNQLKGDIANYWLHAPELVGDYDLDLAAIHKFEAGKNPEPDEMEKMFHQVRLGKLPLAELKAYKQLMMQKEQADLKLFVLEYLSGKESLQLLSIALTSENKEERENAVKNLVVSLYEAQDALIRQKESKGEYYIFPAKRKFDMTLDVLKQELNSQFNKLITQTRRDIEGIVVSTLMPGNISKVHISSPPVNVKKGDVLFTIVAMKMELPIVATQDGCIEHISVVAGQNVNARHALAYYKDDKGLKNLAGNKRSFDQTKTVSTDKFEQGLLRNKKFLQSERDKIAQEVSQKQKHIQQTIDNTHILAATSANNLKEQLQKCGYYGLPLTLTQKASTGHENEIHVIDNRSGCAAKLYADLKQAGYKVIVLYTKGEETTSVIANAAPDEIMRVDSYTDHEDLIDVLKQIAEQNVGKSTWLHPGWGLVSENADFVKKVEELPPQYNVRFVGPPSKAMDLAGGKLSFRELVKKIAPHLNPEYFGNQVCSAKKLEDYIASDYSKTNLLDGIYRKHFEDVVKYGGDVMIKAVGGGGGRGIKRFTYDYGIDPEMNYRKFVKIVQKNVQESEDLSFGCEMITEQCISGKTKHLEAQVVINDMGARVIGYRDCSEQNFSQKITEKNLIDGDYPKEMMDAVNASMLELGKKLSAHGYTGVGTFEMLVRLNPNGSYSVFILEMNTRLQVEHMVTEEDIRLKTGKNVSLPLINLAFTKNKGKTPEEVLADEFNLTVQDLDAAQGFGSERVTHVRLNSRSVDLETGHSIASYFRDYMWLPSAVAEIAAKCDVKITLGGMGEGKYDPQVGAVCGKHANVTAALKEIDELVELSRACFKTDGTLSTPFVQAFYQLVYNAKGNLSNDIDTKTVDEFLKAIESKEIEIEMDYQHLGMNPQVNQDAVRKAFNEFLVYKVNKEQQEIQLQEQLKLQAQMQTQKDKMVAVFV
jgi:acetyl/propionyl-CoA carboxylase alpha subunit